MLEYISGQGRFLVAPRNINGMPGPMIWQGDAPSFEMMMEEDVYERKENYTGMRALAVRRTKEMKCNLSATLVQMDEDVAALLTRGEVITQAVTPIVDEPITHSAELPPLGAFLMLGAFDVSAVTIKDSTSGSPKTLEQDVNYILDAKGGTIEIVDLTENGPFVGPFTASYTPAAVKAIKLLSAAEREYWVRFLGVNTAAEGNPRMVGDWYRVRWSPTTGFGFIQEETGEFPIEGGALADPTKKPDSNLGQFGRMFLEKRV
ncbi:hypothetical protein [Thauera sp.]|uniref:phage tail tube protein n=1 Tax=Thauera sp. TaxID=1905334 RepID=UPI0039E71504